MQAVAAPTKSNPKRKSALATYAHTLQQKITRVPSDCFYSTYFSNFLHRGLRCDSYKMIASTWSPRFSNFHCAQASYEHDIWPTLVLARSASTSLWIWTINQARYGATGLTSLDNTICAKSSKTNWCPFTRSPKLKPPPQQL